MERSNYRSLTNAEVSEHRRRADEVIGNKGDSMFMQDVRHCLSGIRVACVLRFIFCNLGVRSSSLTKELESKQDMIHSWVVWGNPGIGDCEYHSSCPFPMQSVQDASEEIDKEESADATTTSDTQKQSKHPVNHVHDGPVWSASAKKDPATIELAEIDNNSSAIDPPHLSETMEADQDLMLKIVEIETICGRYNTACGNLGHEPLLTFAEFETTADLVQERNQLCEALIRQGEAMWCWLDQKAEPNPFDSQSAFQPMHTRINNGRLHLKERAHQIWICISVWMLAISVAASVAFAWVGSNDTLPVVLSTFLFLLVTFSIGASLFIWVLGENSIAQVRQIWGPEFGSKFLVAAILSQRLVAAMLKCSSKICLLLTGDARCSADLRDTIRQIQRAKEELKGHEDLLERANAACSRLFLEKLLSRKVARSEASVLVDQLETIIRELYQCKLNCLRIKSKREEARRDSPERLQTLNNELTEALKKKDELKGKKMEIEGQIKLLSGQRGTRNSGEVFCWFPEYYLAGNWLEDKLIRQQEQELAQRTPTDILLDLVKADLRIDLERDDVEDASGEEIPALTGRFGVKCKRIKATGELKVWKSIPWSPVSQDSLNQLRLLKRGLRNSRRVVHQNILPCDGAVLWFSETTTSGAEHVEAVYLQSAYQPGGDLARWLAQSPRNAGIKLDVLGKIADALYAMHKIGLCHRDVKPMNIVMSALDDEAEPRLIDFDDSRYINLDGIPTNRTLVLNGLGTIGFMAPELRLGVPADMCENNAHALARWQACDVYSMATTVVNVFVQGTHDEIIQKLDAMTEVLSASGAEDLMNTKQLLRTLRCALNLDWSKRPTMLEMMQALSQRICSLCVDCADREGICEASAGVLCPLGRHFVCSADFQQAIDQECKRDIAIRRQQNGQFTCFHREKCSLDHFYPIEKLRKSLHGESFQAILQSLREIIQAEEAEASDTRVEQVRKSLEAASMAQLVVMQHCRFIIDEIASSRCPTCRSVWYDFSGCSALTCSNCPAKFCAFCASTTFQDNRRAASFSDGQACHRHVASCQWNPTRPDYFCSTQQFEEQRKTVQLQALRAYLAMITDDTILTKVKSDATVRAFMADIGAL